MTCSQVRDLAGAYVLDALPRHDRHQVEQHLHRCPRCRRQMGELSDVVAEFTRAAVPAVPPPARVREQLLRAVQAEGRAGRVGTAASGRRPRAALAGFWRRSGRPLVRALAYAGAASVLFALGWAVATFPALPVGLPAAALQRELMTARMERELWRSLAPPASAVVRLQTDPHLAGKAVAFAAVVGEQAGCRLKVVARGLPPAAAPLRAWVVLADGSLQPVGELVRTAADRWELETLVKIPPARLKSLQLRTAPDAAGRPSPAGGPPAGGTPPAAGDSPASGTPFTGDDSFGAGRKVMWGQLWPEEGEPW